MPTLRITKKYNNKSPVNGLVVYDTVDFASREDGAKWVAAIQANKSIDWDLVDYEWVLVTLSGSTH